jgi:hypothetical protein
MHRPFEPFAHGNLNRSENHRIGIADRARVNHIHHRARKSTHGIVPRGKMRFKSQRVVALTDDQAARTERRQYLFAVLGDPAGVARLFGRHPSTASRWLSGDRPLPADAARELLRLAQYAQSRLIEAAFDLNLDIQQGEARAARGRARRRQAFHDRFGDWPRQVPPS